MQFDGETVAKLAAHAVTHGTADEPFDDRSFVAFFGCSPNRVAEIWEVCSRPSKHLKHLLWALCFMKLYLPEDVLVVMLGCSKPTLKKWTWLWIESIALHSKEVILWEKRNRNVPEDVWCRVSVDGTDFMIYEPHPFDKKWKSPKFKGGGLSYEVAISISSGDIVWVHGPFRGAKHDITMLGEALKHKLDEGEMVEADLGYKGEPDKIKVKHDWVDVPEMIEKQRIRARHETCNHRFKVWGILKQQFRHNIESHGLVFRAIACIVQMGIDDGDVMFGCTTVTRKKKGMYVV